MSDYPRCTELLRDLEIIPSMPPHFQLRYWRRGRLVDDACGWIAGGKEIPAHWWTLSSGDPANPSDCVAHEECRPYIEAYARWLKDTGWHPMETQKPVKSDVWRVRGTIDDLGWFASDPSTWVLIDRKNGVEAPWHRAQLAIYAQCLLEELGIVVKRYNLYLPSAKLVPRTDRCDLEDAKLFCDFWWRRKNYE